MVGTLKNFLRNSLAIVSQLLHNYVFANKKVKSKGSQIHAEAVAFQTQGWRCECDAKPFRRVVSAASSGKIFFAGEGARPH
jgi:hypothetical protein